MQMVCSIAKTLCGVPKAGELLAAGEVQGAEGCEVSHALERPVSQTLAVAQVQVHLLVRRDSQLLSMTPSGNVIRALCCTALK